MSHSPACFFEGSAVDGGEGEARVAEPEPGEDVVRLGRPYDGDGGRLGRHVTCVAFDGPGPPFVVTCGT
ncbi:hypothetical protein ACIGMX_10725 [Streptomyces aquilus]|uniref:Uncharacterized protein n=1 Tax=Streptomyces aquilus TaxID=2548456 RepID=A0A3Q9C227_9ACTN|nr:hypothetical protein [Streptomyces aquilus]AZP19886.1 hypothetical protein EJC51_29720 [Streptomyces aquilus]